MNDIELREKCLALAQEYVLNTVGERPSKEIIRVAEEFYQYIKTGETK